MPYKVIAECAINWNGLDEAKELIRKCAEYGVWAVKFQLFNGEKFKKWQLNQEQVNKLYEYAWEYHVDILFTPMYEEAWDMLYHTAYVKIRYKDSLNIDWVNKALKKFGKVFISTPFPYKHPRIINLLCIPEYPAKMEDYFKNDYMVWYNGISDHTPNTDLMLFCRFMPNIKYFEKHVRLGSGHYEDPWSIEIDELGKVMKIL